MIDECTFTSESTALLPTLYRISFSLVRTEADAQDAVQQALLKAWVAKERVDPERFRPWLTRIVINESRNIQRYRMRVVPTDTAAADSLQNHGDMDVADAVQTLPENLRVLFLLKYLACYKEREIAQIFHLPQTTVKNRLAKARKILKTKLVDTEVSFE